MKKILVSMFFTALIPVAFLQAMESAQPVETDLAHSKAVQQATEKLDGAIQGVKEALKTVEEGTKVVKQLDRQNPQNRLETLKKYKKDLVSACTQINGVELANKDLETIIAGQSLEQSNQQTRYHKAFNDALQHRTKVINSGREIERQLEVLTLENNPDKDKEVLNLKFQKIEHKLAVSDALTQEAKAEARLVRALNKQLTFRDKIQDKSEDVSALLSRNQGNLKKGAGVTTALLAVSGACVAAHHKIKNKRSQEAIVE